MSIAIGKMLEQSGYLQDLRDERSEDAEGRVENLAELVSAAREYESRAIRARRSTASSIGCRCCPTWTKSRARSDARVWLMTLHSAKGLEFPDGHHGRPRRRVCSRTRASSEDEEELEEERRLCYVGMTRARASGWC